MSMLKEVRAVGGELSRLIREALGSLAVLDPRAGGFVCLNAQLDPFPASIRSSNQALPPEKRLIPRI